MKPSFCMRASARCALVALAVASAGCAARWDPARQSAQIRAVRDVVAEWLLAYEQRDLDRLARCFADQEPILLFALDGSCRWLTAEELRAAVAHEWTLAPRTSARVLWDEIQVRADVATASGSMEVRTAAPEASTQAVRFSLTLVRHADRWRLVHAHLSQQTQAEG